MFEWTASVGIVRSELGPQILRYFFCPSRIPLIGMLLPLFAALSLHVMMKIVKSRQRTDSGLAPIVRALHTVFACDDEDCQEPATDSGSTPIVRALHRILLLSAQPWL